MNSRHRMQFLTLNHKKCVIFRKRKYNPSTNWPFHEGLQSYRWDCCEDHCRGKIYTHHKSNEITKFGNHSEVPLVFHNDCDHDVYDETKIIQMKSLNRMLIAVTNGVPPREAYEVEILSGIRVCKAWSGYESVCRTLYNARSVFYPPLPLSKYDIKSFLQGDTETECDGMMHFYNLYN
eukprot:54920_1